MRTECIMELDVPTINNNVYSTETMQNAIDKLNGKPIYGTIGTEFYRSLEQVSHEITNLRIEDGKVYGTVKVLGTPNGQILNQLCHTKFGMMGSGNKDENGVITNFQIHSVNAVSD